MSQPLSPGAGALSDNESSQVEQRQRPRASWVRWRLVLLMMAFSFMSYFNRQSLPVAGVERIMPQYGIDPERMGVAYSAFLVTYTLFMFPGGLLVDRFGPKAALVSIGFGSSVCAVLTGLWGSAMLAAGGSLVAIMIARGLMGIFSAPIYPACGRMLIHWLPSRQRALAMGMIVGSAPVAIASTFVVFGKLIEWIDWPFAFVVAGVVTVALALVWTVYATNDPQAHAGVNAVELEVIKHEPKAQSALEALPIDEPERISAPIREPDGPGSFWERLLTSRSLMLLSVSYAAVGYFEYMLFYWMQYYFEVVLAVGQVESR
jgi:sugar phosphate permease